MNGLIALQCPTCGASLQVAGDTSQCSCQQCGSVYLLGQKAGEIAEDERRQFVPLATHTRQLQQWFKAGEYEVLVHIVLDEKVEADRLVYFNVEYRSNSTETLSCRRSQWVLFDADGYTYDALNNALVLERRERPSINSERYLTLGGHLRFWLAFKLPEAAVVEKLQFLTGFFQPKTVEFLLK